MKHYYFVKELDKAQSIYPLGLRWGVYLMTDVSPVAMGFFYDRALAVAVSNVMNDGRWEFKVEAGARLP